MSQFKRRYVRLEEACDKTHLTKWDILDAIEEGKLSLFAQISAQRLGAIYPPTECVEAIFNYKGIVQLTDSIAERVVHSLEPVSVPYAIITEPNGVSGWRSVGQALGGVQQASFQYEEVVHKQPRGEFVAYTNVNAKPTIEGGLSTMINRLATVLNQDKVSELAKQYPKQDAKRLSLGSITVKPTELRLKRQDIEQVFGARGVFNDVNPTDQPTVNSVNSTVGSLPVQNTVSVDSVEALRLTSVNQRLITHPIEQIIYRALVEQPKLRADKLWVLIRKDVNQNTPRLYDIDNFISEMSHCRIDWFGKGEDSESSMSYDSFRKGAVQRVKAQIAAEKT
ncbi:hypothetical protein AB0539_004632 [Vibrio parahaemolyticus]|uniref:hypothetical protein n=1 Tax=Vibrio parahaemolyticus TaxID=670 RepID=UPI0011229B41|nr:hypothetical protein [Vibrio parahaemolyticus]MBE3731350.1 hypothetical protein [Vibrio parahaemolyticus]TOB76236.1 hypothetical protein CGJ99_22885 [Vibrio parahaemolyticus]